MRALILAVEAVALTVLYALEFLSIVFVPLAAEERDPPL